MSRRLLLTLAGLGTTAAALFLMAGTAHALAPPPRLRPALPPAHLTLPTSPGPTAPGSTPPAVVTVKTVTTKVVQQVKQAAPVKKVAAAVPVVVKHLTGTLAHSLVVPTAAAHRALVVAPNHLQVARSSQSTQLRAATFANAGSPRANTQMRSTRTRPASHRSTQASALPGLTDNALSPAQSSIGSPFAALTTRTPRVSTATQWLTFPTADRTRPGFLVGSARPG